MALNPAAAEPAGPAGPTIQQINEAIQEGDHQLLEELLAQGPRPEVPVLSDELDFICFSYDGSEGSDMYGAMGQQDPFYTLLLSGGIQDNRVACCEALLAAGFRPSVYPNVGFEARAPGDMEFIDRLVLKNFNILFDWQRPDVAKQVVRFQRGVPERVAAPELDGPNRLLVMLIRGEPWSPADHQHYPPAFQAAVRTLLLAHRRHGIALPRRSTRGAARKAAAESQFCPLSQLEPECLTAVVRHLAAPPLAPWLFMQPWYEVIQPDREAVYEELGDLYEEYMYSLDPY